MPTPEPSKLDTLSAVRIATLITFSWSGGVARYARWTSDLTLGGLLYTSLTLCEIDYGDQHGGTQDVPVKINIDATVEPMGRMHGQRYIPVQVVIEELDPTDVSTRRVRFRGICDMATSNPAGKGGVSKLQIGGHKSRLDIPLGILADNDCQWTYGDRHCRKNPTQATAVLDSVVGSRITIATPNAAVLGKADRFWHWGSIRRDGYEIKIRDWLSGAAFSLIRPPPREWTGQSIILTEGCLKTPDACTAKGNAARFGGIGIAMRARHSQLDLNEG